MSKLSVIIIQALLIKLADGIVKPAIHLYSIPSICPNTGYVFTDSSRRHVIHLKLQIVLAVGESDLLSSSATALRSPFSGFPIKVASWRGPNLVKSFDVPTTRTTVPT
ncbi:hypothetical protein AVEN_188905-1 [Araneus ventricosus]|uniref:Secreted protein n=1 Tax=Araneus ventricosus TaxID=182803 RepID=A0A4Y2W0P4_ARAVE|nr:hypothetical protein AVEN_238165-1 [Araneus ventricosus]GBO30956.1 hypothetical protein AVEN_130912-1 [Araneus ventricosus]GBO30959.1 hypothetical protein AVEN_154097-1 [Araneus ventricosus]GBO30962.1 hypothetical protein AVEN_188905-1 [Araneus ventricosus]